ncbi:hypothetical protein KSS87_000546 [Heliosperma pusillum]|nr:hypothetical protein KSS87_000546 [Heliosperma pusillum]
MSYHIKPKPEPESLFDLLSDEVITEILIRIPSKPLCRFKSVSKRLNSIISEPGFLPFYVSRASSWVILDRIPQCAPELTHPTRFQLLDRPKISTCTVNPGKMPDNRAAFSVGSFFPTEILQSSNGLILFAQTIDRGLGKQAQITANGISLKLFEELLFVFNPISYDWVGIAEPRYPINKTTQVVFTTRVDPETGLVGRFMVVEYQPLIGWEDGCLLCFVSDTGKWVEKRGSYMLGKHNWRGDRAFEFEGKFFWVDLSVGLITWDVEGNDYFREVESREKAVCRFIPLPKGRWKQFDTPGLKDERWVGGGGGFVQFIEVFKEGQRVLRCWRLKDCGDDEWSLMYKVSRETVDRFLTSEAEAEACRRGGGSKRLVPCFFHPFEAEVAYFETGDFIFSFNLRTQQFGTCDVFTPHKYVLPFVLPKWSSPILTRLYAAYTKEEGNECFKSQQFTKAIKCYSKSIDLSPNTATFANRALAYLKVKKYQEAEIDCTESLKLNANYFKVYWRRALARKELGNLKGALEDVELGLMLEPKNGEVTKLRAELKSMLEKVSSAGYESCTEGAPCGLDLKAEGN